MSHDRVLINICHRIVDSEITFRDSESPNTVSELTETTTLVTELQEENKQLKDQMQYYKDFVSSNSSHMS